MSTVIERRQDLNDNYELYSFCWLFRELHKGLSEKNNAIQGCALLDGASIDIRS